MSLATNVSSLATRVATEIKSVKTMVNGNAANLSALTTADKTNLVAAINELKAASSSAAGINDTGSSTSSTWSSTKVSSEITAAKNAILGSGNSAALDTLKEFQDAIGNDPTYAATTATALGNRVRFDAAQTLTSPQQVQARANTGAASATEVGDTTTNFVTVFDSGLV